MNPLKQFLHFFSSSVERSFPAIEKTVYLLTLFKISAGKPLLNPEKGELS